LSGNDNQCFLQIEPAAQALLQTADIAFIHFDSARKQIASRFSLSARCIPNALAPFFWVVTHHIA
jgi:hypothetical protein